MLRSPRGRAVALVALLAGLFVLCVWYGTLAPAPEMGAYPGNDEVGATPEKYVGQKVTVAGDVVATDPVRIRLEYGVDEERIVTVRDVPPDVTEGDLLRVFGTLVDEDTVRATNAFTVPQTGLWYTWSISFLAGLWSLGRIVRHWRFSRATWALVPREEPLSVTGGDDA